MAVDQSLGREAFHALDGHWWDQRYRLPNPRLVQRRNFDIGPDIEPWRVPDPRLTPALRAACGGSGPSVLALPEGIDDLRFEDVARLEIDVPKAWRHDEPWKSLGPRVTQRDFPVLIAALRELALEKLGPEADRPD